MLQTIWNTTGGIASNSVFVVVLLAIIIGWILVSLWTRVIENTAFGDLGFNENSSWDSALVAVGITIIFISFVHMIDSYGFVSSNPQGVLSNERFDTIGNGLTNNTSDHLSRNENGNPLAIF